MIGIPHALGGHNYFAEWLQPVLIKVGQAGAVHQASSGLEIGLMAASLTAAVAGIFLARWIYLRSPEVADTAAEVAGGVPYRLSLNKYYVDEVYCSVSDWYHVEIVRRIDERRCARGRWPSERISARDTDCEPGFDVV